MIVRSTLLAILVLLSLAACLLVVAGRPSFLRPIDQDAPSPPDSPSLTLKGILESGVDSSLVDRHSALVPCKRMSLERTSCHGYCPAYEVVFERSGEARYEGFLYVKRAGKHEGRISPDSFARLCQLAMDIGLMDMEDSYYQQVMGPSWTYVSLTLGDREKRVGSLNGAGPLPLWAFQNSIDAVTATVDWHAAKERSQ